MTEFLLWFIFCAVCYSGINISYEIYRLRKVMERKSHD